MKSIVFQNIAVKIYYKNKNNTSFLYISLKSRKPYNCPKKRFALLRLQKNRGSYYKILFIFA